jgi:hypothetical protein
MIKNANQYNLNQQVGTLPEMSGTLTNWFQPMSFVVITKETIDFEVREVQTFVSFMGVRQPMTSQQLQIKPEGQRTWKWETIHALPDLKLKTDDRIKWGNRFYRVMELSDWTEYGYIEYQIVEDFQDGN